MAIVYEFLQTINSINGRPKPIYLPLFITHYHYPNLFHHIGKQCSIKHKTASNFNLHLMKFQSIMFPPQRIHGGTQIKMSSCFLLIILENITFVRFSKYIKFFKQTIDVSNELLFQDIFVIQHEKISFSNIFRGTLLVLLPQAKNRFTYFTAFHNLFHPTGR